MNTPTFSVKPTRSSSKNSATSTSTTRLARPSWSSSRQVRGRHGDGRTYEWVVSLRCVETSDFMTAVWSHLPYELLGKVSNRIINEVRGINRVVYDVSGKPPATIEWE